MSLTTTNQPKPGAYTIERGDESRKTGNSEEAIDAYLAAAVSVETPPADLCLKLARGYERLGNAAEACHWALAVVDAGDDFASWQAAAGLLGRRATATVSRQARAARLALIGSYTTGQLVPLLRLATARLGVALDIYESDYGQYRQDTIDPASPMYRFKPDIVLIAVHDGGLALPDYSDTPDADVEAEARRWTSLWEALGRHSAARVVQHTFAIPPEAPLGHLGARLPGSRYMMAQALNARLGAAAGDRVSLVDCERLAGLYGKERWFDPRYWYLAKQAVALGALPLLARHTAAVVAAGLGLSRKCLVLDLDNTLWGGVIGEDGLAGITLGDGVDGEAFVAFQEYVLKLKDKGVILAVLSKNNEADAREPFEKHPEMRLKLDDIAMFVANWQPKQDQIGTIAKTLNIGLDSIVFVDDNPVEREAVRQFLPEVDVILLPPDPTGYVRALSRYLMFETSSFTLEDAKRTDQYRARAEITAAEDAAGSIEDFYRGLRMQAVVAPFNEVDLPRIAQLISKSNQFNLTTYRHGLPRLQAFMDDPSCVHLSLRLRDRFSDHGLVSLMIACKRGDALDIDTWLMSCRVIGRTVEAELLKHLCAAAERLDCKILTGTYIPTAKNAMVKNVYDKYGFALVAECDGTTTWTYDLQKQGPIKKEFIETVDTWEALR